MVQITIEVPEALAERLATVRDRLPDVLAHGLDALSPLPNAVYRAILEFLASNPSPAAVLHFKPTPQMQERVSALLAKSRAAPLTPIEAAELEEYGCIDNVLSLLKAQAFKRMQTRS